MTLTEFVTSPAYKKFMGYVYGFGAAVAILGALFKILHLPGASVMLVCGLGVEAIIFALSSFEPPHETPDWTLVFPELAGLEPTDLHGRSNGGGSELSALVENGAIDQETVNKLADGVKKLATTTSQMADLSDASVATKSYLSNVKSAADSLNQFSAAQTGVVEAGNKFASQLSAEGSKFVDSFSVLNTSIAQQSQTSTQLGANMTAVSDAYAAQLKGLNTQIESTKSVVEGFSSISSSLSSISSEISASVDGVKEYRAQIASLSKTVGELNSIYGNMLSAIRR